MCSRLTTYSAAICRSIVMPFWCFIEEGMQFSVVCRYLYCIIRPIFMFWGIVVCLNVTVKVLVFFLPPELSLTVMFVMSDTACDFNSDNISCMSQSMSSLHLITPLQELSDLCGVTLTGRSIMDFSLLIWRLWVAEDLKKEAPTAKLLGRFQCTNCALDSFINHKWGKFIDWFCLVSWPHDKSSQRQKILHFVLVQYHVPRRKKIVSAFLSTMTFLIKKKPWWVCKNLAS